MFNSQYVVSCLILFKFAELYLFTMSDTITAAPALTAKDFATDQEVRWCPRMR
jgi:hypothetical protein